MKTATTSGPKTFIVTDWDKQEYTVTIEHNKSIDIACTYRNRRNPMPTLKHFMIGDEAEFDSYNLRYTGKIISITEKTVTIEEWDKVRHRLRLGDFCFRNWDFDAAKVAAENHETLMVI